jgi:hypothetical protein
MTECPICKAPSTQVPSAGGGTTRVNCLRCGVFNITAEADGVLRSQPLSLAQSAAVSSQTREKQGCLLNESEVATLRKCQSPPISTKAVKLLRYLGEKSKPGRGVLLNLVELDLAFRVGKDKYPVNYNPVFHQENPNYGRNAELIGVCGAENYRELVFLLEEYLKKDKRLIADPQRKINSPEYQLTSAGWELLEQPQERSRLSNIGFVAMWFNESTTLLFTSAIQPAVEAAGFVAKRIDQHPHNNRIDDEIMKMISVSRFIVADFTGQRGSVYFEAGFAVALGLPVIWLCRRDQLNDVHFDTRQYNFLTWTDNELESCRSRLFERIETTIGRGAS